MDVLRKNIKYDQFDRDLIFQITSSYGIDYEYDEDPVNDTDDLNKYLIKVFGVTEDGLSVSVNVNNFTPYFYIKLFNVDKYTGNKLQEFIVSKLPFALKTSLIDVNIMKKKDFWGFTGTDKFYFARFKFKNLKAYKFCIRLFSRKVHISSLSKEAIKYKLYESNIEPFLRMMHIRDIDPSGWICIPKNTYVAGSFLSTQCQIDIECDWKFLTKFTKEKIAPIMIASFDIECTSSHGDFPVARKNYKKTAYELFQYFEEHKTDENIKDFLCNELKKIFDHTTPGILSKVFSKGPIKIKDLEGKIDKFMDDIFTILKGKLSYKNKDDSTKDEKLNNLMNKLGNWKDKESRDYKKGSYKDKYWEGIFPQLEGDSIIQIGTTIHRYGDKDCVFKSIITVDTCDTIDNVHIESCQNERELLLAWRDLIIKLDPDIMTGYNIFGFDISYMYERAIELGIENEFCKIGRLIDHRSEYIEKELSSAALGDNLLKYIEMEGRVLIDVMKVVQRDHKLDSYRLDAVASHFMKMNKNDVHPSDIFRLQKGSSADRKIIADYCVQDCALCNHLIMKLEIIANNIGMSNVCNVPLSYIFMRGQGIKIFSLVAKECRTYDFLIPTITPGMNHNDSDNEEDDDGFEGAIVLEPKTGIYIDDPISVLDYASLYPSSMISENLSHDSIILNKKYDNLPGYEYLDINYDVYEKIDKKKVKTGEKIVRFVQLPNNEKGTIPKILLKLLRQRKETRKKIEFQTVLDSSNNEYIGLIKKYEDHIIITSLDGSSHRIENTEITEIKDTYDDFQKAVLDGLQLAYKITANSLYGQCGARTSPIYMKEIAACTTAIGRKMILLARDYILGNFKGSDIIYGDSCTSYTPVLIKHNDIIKIDTIENLAIYGNNIWEKCNDSDKEYCELTNIFSWTDDGWTQVFRIIRHKLVETKKIIRINTHSGIVDVTDDHSLLTETCEEISPKNLNVGDKLLHNEYPNIIKIIDEYSENEARIMGFFCGDGSCGHYETCNKSSWALNNSDMELQKKYKNLCENVYPDLEWVILDTLESSGVYKLVPKSRNCNNYGGIRKIIMKYRELFYHNKEKKIPFTILNAPYNIRKSFWEGLYDADVDKEEIITRIDQKNQLSMATFNFLGASLGYKTSLNSRTDKFRLNLTKSYQRKDKNIIKKLYEIPYSGYVYDLTTENHHFQAGIGKLIVHNTDSLFVRFNPINNEGQKLRGKEAILPSIKLAMEASRQLKPLLKPPHDAEYEKTFWPFILFSKKRYCANKYEFDDEHFKMNYMGIALKRRDNANIVKKIYGGVLDIILNDQDIKKSLTFLHESLNSLINGKYGLDDLIITKSLKSIYKDPTRIAHKVLAERMGERDPGTKPQVNDRIPYVYIEVPEKKGQKLLQGNKIEHPSYIKEKNLKPDYEFYITNQIMNPILQLYALILEDLDGYKKGVTYFEDIKKKLIKEKEGDMIKVKDKLNDLREDEVKKLLFEPILIKLKNKRNRNHMITDYFKIIE